MVVYESYFENQVLLLSPRLRSTGRLDVGGSGLLPVGQAVQHVQDQHAGQVPGEHHQEDAEVYVGESQVSLE